MKSISPRRFSQGLFIFSSILICIFFARFVNYLSDPALLKAPYRPPGVEAYLPISSLISFVLFLKTGILSKVHPAGLVIFSALILMSFMLRRGFCSWMCPIGAMSELVGRLSRYFFGKSLSAPEWLDIILKSLKFYILIFFLFNIFRMTPSALMSFVNGEYNAITDAKMFLFFANISGRAFGIILLLVVLTMILRNFWCRFLCPYGAFLGSISMISPVAVRRNLDTCINCKKCTNNCPNEIRVHEKSRVNSAECMACYTCIEKCPVPGTLNMEFTPKRSVLKPLTYGSILVLTYIIITQTAALAGYWKSDIPPKTVKKLFLMRDKIGHPSMNEPCGDKLENCKDSVPPPEHP